VTHRPDQLPGRYRVLRLDQGRLGPRQHAVPPDAEPTSLVAGS
jgi:hypothetical protein